MFARIKHPWLRVAAVAVLCSAAISCDQDGMPTAPADEDAATETAAPQARPLGPDGLFSPLVRQVDPRQNILVSTEAELAAGRYRYQLGAEPVPAIARDEFLFSTIDGDPFVRRVLTSELSSGELILETGPAYWHEVLQAGTYGMTVPIGRDAPATLRSGTVLPALMATDDSGTTAALNIGPPTQVLAPLTVSFRDEDLCPWINAAVETFGDKETLCDGEEHEYEKGTGVIVSLSGRLDTLKIVEGRLTVSGDMDVDMTVDIGGISGGTPPTFYPCSQAAYQGCFTTPTGAEFIEWLRKYVPQLPEASLPPIRLCVPGLPVRIKAGYWDYSGWLPVWRFPQYTQCSVATKGVLPTVTLPSMSSSTSRIKPHVDGIMTVRAVGDGTLKIKVPVPQLGYSKVFNGGSGRKAKAEVGAFIEFVLKVTDTGVSVTYESDRIFEVAQDWNPDAGWSSYHEVYQNDRKISVHNYTNPDSISVRLGVVTSAGLEVCFAFTVCEVSDSDLEVDDEAEMKLVAKAGADVAAFVEATWNREPVHPTDASIDNWHLSTDFAYDLHLEASLDLPHTDWIWPSVPREWEDTFECCRLRINDMYGVGMVNVETQTTGAAPDPDGYQVQLSRMDTLPVVIDVGATRFGKARDHGKPLQLDVSSTGRATFGHAGAVPCAVWYSDAALLFADPTTILVVGGLRAAGINVPAYAMAGFCDLVIGRYQVKLTGVAENCSVVGGPTRDDVWLLQSKQNVGRFSNLTDVDFDVVCAEAPEMGELVVTTSAATSPDFTANYEIFVDDVSHGLIGPSERRTLTYLLPGTRNVKLVGGPSNCAVPVSWDIDVVRSAIAEVDFAADCTLPPGALAVEATTTGATAGVHQLVVNGVPTASLPLQGRGIATGLIAEAPTVVHVTPAASNCRAGTPTPFVIALNAARDPLTVPFGLECTAGMIITAEGVIESSANAAQPVRLRLDDGTTRALAGPSFVRQDLEQLGGARVRVRGEMLGTSLSIYGYDLMPAAGEQVWIGIVIQRDGGWWLLGEKAVRMTNAPAGITGSSGDLMWVSGTPGLDNDVTVRLYGSLRRPE